MAKSKKIALSVPIPCSENWDEMTPVEKGRFCKQCNKSVIDFTTYTDKELLNFFYLPKEHVCGNFRSTQLNRLIALQEPSQTPFWHKVMLGASIAAGTASIASGQSNSAPQQRMQQVDIKNKTGVSLPIENTPAGDTTYISGMVVDASHHPIPNAAITIMKDSTVLSTAVSYDDGHFIAMINGSFVGQTITIKIKTQYAGDQEMNVHIDKLRNDIIVFMLNGNLPDLNVRGAVSPTTTYVIEVSRKTPPYTTPKDSISRQEMLNKHLGTPASQEGQQEPNR